MAAIKRLTPDEAMAMRRDRDGRELEWALIDVREHGQHGEGHPFLSNNVPYSQLESIIAARVPRRGCPVVLLDDGDGVAERAAVRLTAIGYDAVHVVTGGAPAWRASGRVLFKGQNVPSKTFGELVEHAMDTPHVTAEQLKAMMDRGERFVLLDGRTDIEYRRMTIPGSRHCPNAELAHRVPVELDDPSTPIVVNCAGRTRSIIGAQSLRNLDLPNPVFALKDGTQGWRLAGFELQVDNDVPSLGLAGTRALERSRADGEALRERFGIPSIDLTTLDAWRADDSRSLFVLDVRTAEEFRSGTLPDAVHAPGGQLVQATDQWIAPRGVRIVLCDDTGLRATGTAIWLRGMGHQAVVLEADASTIGAAPEPPLPPAVAGLASIGADELAAGAHDDAVVLDLRPGMDYREGHIAGARWAIRPRLASLQLLAGQPVVVADGDSGAAELAAIDLTELGHPDIRRLRGDSAEWRAAGLTIEASPREPSDAECIDFLFFVHDRHSGNPEAARAYLAWETQLLDQMSAEDRTVLAPLGATA